MNFVLPDEERFAGFLRSALQEVHTPVPAAPREEIWASIMEQRRGGRISATAARPANVSATVPPATVGLASVVATQAVVVPAVVTQASAPVASASTHNTQSLPLRRLYAVPMRWAFPIAAAVLVVGVGVGWQFEHSRNPHSGIFAEAPTRLPAELPTQVVAEQHFTEVEQLLASFASVQNNSSASAENNAIAEAQVAAWARDLLGTTQLLLDSPLGMDPVRRKLLTDVEMMLVQISQLAPNSIPDDREITEQSIEQSQMMERLQHVAPAVPQPQKAAPARPSEAPQGI